MKGKYTHKFIIYNEKSIQNNEFGLIDELVKLEDTIPLDLVEALQENSKDFEKLRGEFLQSNKNQLWAIDEILRIDEETNTMCNKVLAFVNKYPQFCDLVSGIDYFDGEEEFIEGFIPKSRFSSKFIQRFLFQYYYGIEDNRLNIFLRNIGRNDLIQF